MHLPFHASDYLKWDERLERSLRPDDLIRSLADDLMRDGNLDLSLQRAFRWGAEGQDGSGLNDLLQRLRERQQELLSRFDFGSSLNDLRERLDEIVRREAEAVDDRLQALNDANDLPPALGDMMLNRLDKLSSLPSGLGKQVDALKDYEFIDQQAGKDFQQLVEDMQQGVMDALFNSMKEGMQNASESAEATRDFLHDINEAFEAEARGEQPDLDTLNNRWGEQLGGRVSSMSELRERLRDRMNAAQAMLQMLSPGQRADLLSAMDQTLQDAGLMEEFQRLRSHLGQPFPQAMPQPMGEGSEDISLGMGVQVLEDAGRMQQLENELRSVRRPADLAGIDPDLIQRVLESDDKQWLDDWSHIEEDLEDSGLINRDGHRLELTPRAVRLIGEKALEEVFSSLKQLGVGDHDTNHSGAVGELNNATRPWVFGDPLALDLPRTVMNAVLSGGIGTPVRLQPDHFEVQDREARTATATALLIDMSRSMFFNGSWEAAKRSALALDTLIRGKYPRDTLELIGFSATAHSLDMTDLPTLEWNEYTYGTNLQHALQLAREKLASERGRNRQVIVITDGEPTAHISNGHVHFQHPTTPETHEATVREVLRCTREDITITTFLLESDPRLRDFIEGLMQVNRGKVIAVSPNRLGSYVLRDFLTGRTRLQAG